MTRKTQIAYNALLNELRQIYGNILNPTEVMVDFEAGLIAAVKDIFPAAVIFGCWFHHCQVITINILYKKISKFSTLCSIFI